MLNLITVPIGVESGDVNIIRDIVSALACPAVAFLLFGWSGKKKTATLEYPQILVYPESSAPPRGPVSLAILSLMIGILIAMSICVLPVGLLAWYCWGQNLPHPLSIIIGIGFSVIILMGTKVEVTGNLLIDTIICSGPITVVTFIVVNGFFSLPGHITQTGMYVWAVLCVLCSVITRIIIFAIEGR